MANSRNPTSWTPLTRKELQELRAQLERSPQTEVRETYEDALEKLKLFGSMPPKPWVIQTLVQAWQVLYKRCPKGR